MTSLRPASARGWIYQEADLVPRPALGWRGFAASLWLAATLAACAQVRPYIGFVYPAGGQQGTSFQVRLGGQGLDDVQAVLISGAGVTGKITENFRRLNNQEMQLLNEQLRVLRRQTMSDAARSEAMESMSETGGATNGAVAGESRKELARGLIDRIEKRTREFVQVPANAALSSLVLAEMTVEAGAEPGEREIRLVTLRGVSNPLVFYVGQVPEFSRKPMMTASKQVLGKEAEALRRRPPAEAEERVTVPCTLNGQIASGEVNGYRFEGRKGQRLVVTTLGRQLVPFIADAVPGWFQPVIALYDADGKEVAYADDYRFNPDPTFLYEVPRDGEYRLAIHDSLYRGREDFVYRITMGELPWITNLVPSGASAAALKDAAGEARAPKARGWNLEGAEVGPVSAEAAAGTHWVTARRGGFVSNPVPFDVDSLPEISDREPNDLASRAQKIWLPVIINGCIDRPGDRDIFQFNGRSNQLVVAEVRARRLDSPLDSIVKLTDKAGAVLALNDDHEDASTGINTHQADSYLAARLPADGVYCVEIGDTARQGGPEYSYRLRISAPRPDFELRVVPSSVALRSKSTGVLTVYALRKDGFDGPIKLALKNAPTGISALPTTVAARQTVARLSVRTTLAATEGPVNLIVVGTAKIGEEELTREAVPAEDRMQAFLWRSLVPARELKALVFDPAYQPPPLRVAPTPPAPVPVTNAPVSAVLAAAPAGTNALSGTNAPAAAKPKFSKQQVAARLRQLKLLFEEGMLTQEFYVEKVVECQAGE